MRDEFVKEGRETHEGPWSQAKELDSQWGPFGIWGRVVTQSDLSCPRSSSGLEQRQQGASALLAAVSLVLTPGFQSLCAHPPGAADASCTVWGLELWPEKRTRRERGDWMASKVIERKH